MEPLDGGGQSFNLKQYLAKVKAGWYWLALSILICMAAAFFYLRYTTPIYSTSAQILIQGKGNNGEAAVLSELSGFGNPGQSMESQVMILTTRQLMQSVVRDLKANIIYLHKGDVLDVELYDPAFIFRSLDSTSGMTALNLNLHFSGNDVTISNEAFSKKVKFFEPFQLPGIGRMQLERKPGEKIIDGEYIVKFSSVNTAASRLLSKLSVGTVAKGLNVLNVSLTGPVPRKSEDIINKLIENYIASVQLDKNMVADSTIAFIENRLRLVGAELGDIEGDVESFKQRNKLTDITSQAGQLVAASNDYTKQLAEIETQLSILDAVKGYLEKEGNDKQVLPSGALLADPTFNALVGRYNALVQERERSGLSQTASNPYIKNLDEQIAGVRADILRNFENLRNTLIISRNRLNRRSDVVESQVRNVPTIERTYLDMSRQQEIKQQIYTYLLQKREEIGISKTTDVTNCKVIEPPHSSGPISPKNNVILGVAFFMGLCLPLAIIYLLGLFNTKVNTKEDVLKHTHVPVIAEISTNKDKETIIVSKNPRSPIAEQFRALRTNLAFFLKEQEKTILVTSSKLGEGKSFLSVNLATMLAMSGKKVLMMEMDLRKPNLTNKLHLSSDMGVTNFITSPDLTASDIILPSGIDENLYLISSGPLPPNPAETILKPRLDDLMRKLITEFDYIIIDAPPAGQVTDAQLLSKYADLTLYLVRQRYTEQEHLKIAEDLYVNEKIKNIALVINDISVNPAHGYNNEYGYGYGYGEEELHKGFFSRLFSR